MTTLATIILVISFFFVFEGVSKQVTNEDPRIFDTTKILIGVIFCVIGVIFAFTLNI